MKNMGMKKGHCAPLNSDCLSAFAFSHCTVMQVVCAVASAVVLVRVCAVLEVVVQGD